MQKRIMRDAQDLRLKPIPAGNAAPVGDDLYHWHGNIIIPLKIDSKTEQVPMHFHIELTDKYPQAAPNVGFCAEFDYWNGANEKVTRECVLKGMKQVCMNILSNYAQYHGEWDRDVGAGWTPAMTIKSLIVQLQVEFTENIGKQSKGQKEKFFKSCKTYECSVEDTKHTYYSLHPPVQGFEDKKNPNAEEIKVEKNGKVEEKKEENKEEKKEENKEEAKEEAKDEGKPKKVDLLPDDGDFLVPGDRKEVVEELKQEKDEDYNNLLRLCSQQSVNEDVEMPNQDSLLLLRMQSNDCPLVCYVSRLNYMEEILGFGFDFANGVFSTPAEFISIAAYEEGVRKSTRKEHFEYFLPIYLTDKFNFKLASELLYKHAQNLIEEKLQLKPEPLPNYGVVYLYMSVLGSYVADLSVQKKLYSQIYLENFLYLWRTAKFLLTSEDNKQDIIDYAYKQIDSYFADSKDCKMGREAMIGFYLMFTDEDEKNHPNEQRWKINKSSVVGSFQSLLHSKINQYYYDPRQVLNNPDISISFQAFPFMKEIKEKVLHDPELDVKMSDAIEHVYDHIEHFHEAKRGTPKPQNNVPDFKTFLDGLPFDDWKDGKVEHFQKEFFIYHAIKALNKFGYEQNLYWSWNNLLQSYLGRFNLREYLLMNDFKVPDSHWNKFQEEEIKRKKKEEERKKKEEEDKIKREKEQEKKRLEAEKKKKALEEKKEREQKLKEEKLKKEEAAKQKLLLQKQKAEEQKKKKAEELAEKKRLEEEKKAKKKEEEKKGKEEGKGKKPVVKEEAKKPVAVREEKKGGKEEVKKPKPEAKKPIAKPDVKKPGVKEEGKKNPGAPGKIAPKPGIPARPQTARKPAEEKKEEVKNKPVHQKKPSVASQAKKEEVKKPAGKGQKSPVKKPVKAAAGAGALGTDKPIIIKSKKAREQEEKKKVDDVVEKAVEEKKVAKIDAAQESSLSNIYKSIDKSNSNELTQKQLLKGLKDQGFAVTESQMVDLFAKADSDRSGVVSEEEFVQGFAQVLGDLKATTQVEEFKTAFQVFDSDNSGAISQEEFFNVLTQFGTPLAYEEIEDMFETLDKNKDGQLDFQEFIQYCLQNDENGPIDSSLVQIYKKIDKNNTNELTQSQLHKGLTSLGYGITESQLIDIFSKADSDRSGVLSEEEFVKGFKSVIGGLKGKVSDQEFREAFQAFDTDGSGSISRKEFFDILATQGSPMNHEELEELFDNLDLNGDGVLSYDEFVQYCVLDSEGQNLSKIYRKIDKLGDNELTQQQLYKGLCNQGFAITESQMIDLFAKADADRSGVVSQEEFINGFKSVLGEVKDKVSEKEYIEAFKSFDIDGSGSISREEFMKVLSTQGTPLRNEELIELFTSLDTNKDGELSFSEFVQYMSQDIECQTLIQLYKKMDKSGSNELTQKQLLKGLLDQGYAVTESQIIDLFAQADQDRSGVVSIEEFVPTFKKVIGSLEQKQSDSEFKAAFHTFDADNNGSISREEFFNILSTKGAPLQLEKLQDMFDDLDKNKDGVLSFEEFIEFCKQDETHEELESIYNSIDKNGSGELTQKQLLTGLNKLGFGITESQIIDLFSHADSDRSGVLSLEEFTKGFKHSLGKPQRKTTKSEFRDAFNLFDQDQSGFISSEEFKNILSTQGTPLQLEEIEEMFETLDLDKDGKLSYEEFVNYCQQ